VGVLRLTRQADLFAAPRRGVVVLDAGDFSLDLSQELFVGG
jgi:hypothetical protein